MNFQLTILELGNVLKKIEDNHKLSLLIKANQSGGWLTLKGDVTILNHPKEISGASCASKFNNIISMKLKNEELEGSVIKITGAKGKKFNVAIDSAKYKALSTSTIAINQVRSNENECTLKIDDNMVFSIKAPAKDIINYIK
ncbi:MAG: UDP-N-acetylglucosamine pyrophosphorylase [Clostridium sp.]|nr:UDP-N-acetylglucosamine pyrophosphorylase [Clostridium sp.]